MSVIHDRSLESCVQQACQDIDTCPKSKLPRPPSIEIIHSVSFRPNSPTINFSPYIPTPNILDVLTDNNFLAYFVPSTVTEDLSGHSGPSSGPDKPGPHGYTRDKAMEAISKADPSQSAQYFDGFTKLMVHSSNQHEKLQTEVETLCSDKLSNFDAQSKLILSDAASIQPFLGSEACGSSSAHHSPHLGVHSLDPSLILKPSSVIPQSLDSQPPLPEMTSTPIVVQPFCMANAENLFLELANHPHPDLHIPPPSATGERSAQAFLQDENFFCENPNASLEPTPMLISPMLQPTQPTGAFTRVEPNPGKRKRDSISVDSAESEGGDQDAASASKKPKHNLDPHASSVLTKWYEEHYDNPYPSTEEKQHLSVQARLSYTQVSNWFTNKRKRQWAPEMKKKSEAERRRQRQLQHHVGPVIAPKAVVAAPGPALSSPIPAGHASQGPTKSSHRSSESNPSPPIQPQCNFMGHFKLDEAPTTRGSSRNRRGSRSSAAETPSPPQMASPPVQKKKPNSQTPLLLASQPPSASTTPQIQAVVLATQGAGGQMFMVPLSAADQSSIFATFGSSFPFSMPIMPALSIQEAPHPLFPGEFTLDGPSPPASPPAAQ